MCNIEDLDEILANQGLRREDLNTTQPIQEREIPVIEELNKFELSVTSPISLVDMDSNIVPHGFEFTLSGLVDKGHVLTL